MVGGPVALWSGVVRREGTVRRVTATSGVARPGRPIGADTRFQAGSISKAVLAITVLRLVERGALDLRSPIGTWMPSLPAPKAVLTVHQLLTHTAGLGHWTDLTDVDMADPPERSALLRIVLERPAPHPTGVFSYSAFGYLLAASIIEASVGRPYAEAAAEAVFDPARMTRSSSGAFPSETDDFATGHRGGVTVRSRRTPTGIPGTGDLWTTSSDLVRLGRALHGGKLLRPEQVGAMTSPLVRFGAAQMIADDRIRAHGYGYGAWIGTVGGAPAVVHPGDNVGYRSMLIHLMSSGDDIAILTNDDGYTLRAPLDLVVEDS